MASRNPDYTRRAPIAALMVAVALLNFAPPLAYSQPLPVVPKSQRGGIESERLGTHDAANIRTLFWNFGMVGDYPHDPGNVDLSVFHSVEVPKGTGMNYSNGITPFVLAKVRDSLGNFTYIMETGFRERQAVSPISNRVMRFEPRPGYFQPNPTVNQVRSPAISNDPRTWPGSWPDKLADTDDPGWTGSWDGYFGKRPAADQESYTVMDDDYYDAFPYYPDSRDPTRRGLGLRVGVRSFQWSDSQAGNVIFWHYEITNESTTDYDDNIIFGLYAESGVGGSALSCDGILESDDDNVYLDKSLGLDVVYTWDRFGHGVDVSGLCENTGYLGYAYLETPGNALNHVDDDDDGCVDEQRDGGPGIQIVGQSQILDYWAAHYDTTKFTAFYGPIVDRPAYDSGAWWTGDEEMDWRADINDLGADGVPNTHDTGEGDGIPSEGEANFDRTDVNESDQIGLSGFKMNRIRAGSGNPNPTIDDIVFYTDAQNWPARLYGQFSNPDPAARFDPPVAENYNLGFLFASGPFFLKQGQTERFSVALAYGADLTELREAVNTVQMIYNANYQLAVPSPPAPVEMAFDFTPNTLNLISQGRWVTGFLEPVPPFAASDIDIASITLNGTVHVDPAAPTALGDHNRNSTPDLMVKFNRAEVSLALSEGDNVPVNVTGIVDGHAFAGTDYIRVPRTVLSTPLAGSRLQAGSMTHLRWEMPRGVTVQSVDLLQSIDGGSTWSLIISGQPNTGSYDWIVPNVQTDHAKVAVVLSGSADETGDVVDGVLSVSEAFSIETLAGVEDRGPARFALRSVTPNPAQHELRVSFSLHDSKAATLALFDVSGRQLATSRVDGMGPGWHTVTLGGRSNLAPGLYVIRLTQEERSITTRAALLR
jgi:hypothetical protein